MMTKLNQRQQTILTLRFFSHMTIPEIAGTIGMKEGTVKSHIHRALKKLQSLMVQESTFFQTQKETTSFSHTYVTQSAQHCRIA
jgi:DNA-binding NarL/FixJ family response regulator